MACNVQRHQLRLRAASPLRAAASPMAARSTAPSRSAQLRRRPRPCGGLFRLSQSQSGPAGPPRLQRLRPAERSRRRRSPARILPRRCGGSATANPGTAVIFADPTRRTAACHLDRRRTRAGNDHSGHRRTSTTSRRSTISSGRTSATSAASSPTMKSAPAIKPYLEFMFMDDHTLAQIAPSGDFGNTLTINCDNPLIVGRRSAGPADQFDTICGTPEQSDHRLRRQLPADLGQRRSRARPILFPNTVPRRRRLITAASSSCFAATPKAVRVSPT